jgi:hypothetical protein
MGNGSSDRHVQATIAHLLKLKVSRRSTVSAVAEFLRFNTTPEQRMRLFQTENVGAAAEGAVPQGETS